MKTATSGGDGEVLVAALDLLDLGYWPVPIHPRGIIIGKRICQGKEPIGTAWGLERWTAEKLRAKFAVNPGAGVGICFGPERGPGGSWLIDIEGDGERAVSSLEKLIGGEAPDTTSWASTRGSHRLFRVHGPRLLGALKAAGAKEKKSAPGVWHLPQFPDLEFRVGGFKEDGVTVKQVQSVVPPTPGTDGQPRAWIDSPEVGVAELPEVAYETLAALGYGPAACEGELAALAIQQAGGRHDAIRDSCMRLAGLVKADKLDEERALQTILEAARANGLEAEGRLDEVHELWASAMGKATPRRTSSHRNGRARAGFVGFVGTSTQECPDFSGGNGQAAGGFVGSVGTSTQECPDFSGIEPRPIAVDLLPVPPLDPRLLPDPFRAWIVDMAERAWVPLEFPAAAALVAAGGLIGRRLAIRPKRRDRWMVVPNIWGCAIGPPGVLKTPSVEEALRPLKRLAA
jgi:hypothetical protein